MGLLETVERLFGTRDLYEALGASKNDKTPKLKKAYYTAAMRFHPDKQQTEDAPEATQKFQAISVIWHILGDEQKRKLYDEEGLVVDGESLESYKDWRELYSEVSVEQIKAFAKMYQNSAEEREDLKKAYVEAEGDMDIVFENVMCSNVLDDEDRFSRILKDMIEADEVPAFLAFTGEGKAKRKKRRRNAEEEAAEAEQMLEGLKQKSAPRSKGKKKSNPPGSLEMMILQNREKRATDSNSFFARLEERYGGAKGKKKKGGSKKKTNAREPTEEEFAAVQARVKRR